MLEAETPARQKFISHNLDLTSFPMEAGKKCSTDTNREEEVCVSIGFVRVVVTGIEKRDGLLKSSF